MGRGLIYQARGSMNGTTTLEKCNNPNKGYVINNPQIDTIFKRGDNGAGVLLLHGFTGTPDSMRPVVNALHAQGFTVLAPLLAGHGMTAEKLAQTGWNDWLATAQKSFSELKENCSKVYVGGLSLGALLTLKMATLYPQSIEAIACLATPLYLKAWVRGLLPVVMNSPAKSFWKYQKKMDIDVKDPAAKENFWNIDQMPLSCIASLMDLQHDVRENLWKIQTPTLLIHSRHDSTAPYDSMNRVAAAIGSSVTETVTLENSFHIITLDYDKELVADKVCDFFKRFL